MALVMNGPGAAILSILMIAAFMLGAGGASMLAKGRDRKKAGLMLLAAAVMLLNVLIWTL